MQADTTLPPRQQVQVWRDSKARVLHGVRLAGDSLIGVPFQQPPSCDSCRIALVRNDVDSLRVGNQEAPAILWASLPFVLLIYLLVSLRGSLD